MRNFIVGIHFNWHWLPAYTHFQSGLHIFLTYTSVGTSHIGCLDFRWDFTYVDCQDTSVGTSNIGCLYTPSWDFRLVAYTLQVSYFQSHTGCLANLTLAAWCLHFIGKFHLGPYRCGIDGSVTEIEKLAFKHAQEGQVNYFSSMTSELKSNNGKLFHVWAPFF